MTPEASDSWQYEVPTAGSKRLPPDARYVEALTSQGYSFEAAVADLVDNSIDAGAHKVVISFLRDGDRLVSLLIVDDGRGMDAEGLDVAMTVGGRRGYDAKALGMYGTGLKAASMSHAEAVTLISRTKTRSAGGRRWLTAHAKDDHRCDIVEPVYCQSLVDRYNGIIGWHGTIVRWDKVRAFETIESRQTDRYLDEAIEKLETHLGLYLHRFLSHSDFLVDIVVEDVHTQEELDHRSVLPIDPFGYRVPGKAGYPRTLTAPVEGLGDLSFTAHIWPPKSPLVGYKNIGALAERQGFYFYRNDRLVQAGGWNGYRLSETHVNLARIAIDLPPQPNPVFKLTVKKEGVDATQAFARGLEKATDPGGRTFHHFIEDAQTVYREASRRSEPTRKSVIPPGKGIDPQLKRTLREELPELPHEDPIAFRWDSLPEDVFFELDREDRVVRLNKEYRAAFNGGRRSGSNDAPVVKSMLYLLVNEIFQKERVRAVHNDNVALWNTVLVSAARCELAR